MNFDKIIKLEKTSLKTKLFKELKTLDYKPISEDGFIYAEGELPVLLVAHMDTVHRDTVSTICKSAEGVWMAPEGIGGDDRCGIYAILQIVRHYKCHVLFTEDEEVGCVGAKKFVASGIKPEVCFLIELDRKGSDDCVFYQCDNKEFAEYIEGFGFKTAWGSCSDISNIAPYLGKAAVNLSIGYYNPHTLHEFIIIDDMWNTIRRVETILSGELNEFIYIEKKYVPTTPTSNWAKDYTPWWKRDEESNVKSWEEERKKYLEKKKEKEEENSIDALVADLQEVLALPEAEKVYSTKDEEVKDVAWLDIFDDIFFAKYPKSDTIGFQSVADLGVDNKGNFWRWDTYDDISIDSEVEVYDSDYVRVSADKVWNYIAEHGMTDFCSLRYAEDEAKKEEDLQLSYLRQYYGDVYSDEELAEMFLY